MVHGSTKAERRATRERVSTYYEAELAKLVEQVERAIARYRAGEIDVHDVDEVIRRYSKAARELWKFCWSGGSGSHLLFVARTLELWAAEADEVDWWRKRRGVAGAGSRRATLGGGPSAPSVDVRAVSDRHDSHDALLVVDSVDDPVGAASR